MGRNDSPARREARAEAAEARAAVAELKVRATMTPTELAAHNAALAAEKASHEEGGGHQHLELRPVELLQAKHVSRYRWTSGGERVLNPDAERCPLQSLGCEGCLREDDSELSQAIARARTKLKLQRIEEAKHTRQQAATGKHRSKTWSRAG